METPLARPTTVSCARCSCEEGGRVAGGTLLVELDDEKSFWSFMAAPMSPLIFSLPVMYAVVGFWSPATIFSNVSPLVEMVASASPAPSATSILPSATVTSHWPSPSMSKRYELFIPASFDASARDASPSKKSLAATRVRLPFRSRR